MIKATHKGHCQACGSLQALPKNLLSLHGYNVKHGFFSGICRGAKHQPFEKSCGLVAQFIVEAEDALRRVLARQIALRSPAMDPVAIVRVYVKEQYRYEWQRHEVRAERWGAEMRWTRFFHGDLYSQHVRLTDGKYDTTDPRVIATHYNRVYASWLDHEVKSLRRYIAWQTDRVAKWAEQPLLPVTTRDKAAFTPDKPAYETTDATVNS